MIEPARAVFLSYASQDAEAARRIADTLRSAGVEVWFDQSELRGGDVWDQRIRHQIRECALFLPIISSHTQQRSEGYFRLEWRLADQRTHLMGRSRPFIVPVCVDDTSETDADVPDSFSAAQWTRLHNGDVQPAFVKLVLRLLSTAASHAPGVVSSPADPAAPHIGAAPQPVQRSEASRPKRVLVLIAAVAIIGIGYIAVDKLWLSKNSADMQTSLATVRPGNSPQGGAIPEKSVAVLPFVDMSEKKDQEYFSDGLSEELIDLLAQVQDLRVPARTSSFAFKGKADDVTSIAQKLRVAQVLEGSVRKAGNTLRVTVQLIRADNGYHLWSKTYDRDIKDIFKVQDEIAAAVVEVLKAKLAPAQTAAQTPRPSTSICSANDFTVEETPTAGGERSRPFAKRSNSIRPTLRPMPVSLSQSTRSRTRPAMRPVKGKRWPTPREPLLSHRRRPMAMRRAEFSG
jgi:TolB-like protein